MEAVAERSGVAECICSLCAGFYALGWMTGTGGAMSVRRDGIVYVTASGIQKEQLTPRHVFRFSASGEELRRPWQEMEGEGGHKALKVSSCKPLFDLIFRATGANAVIHTHSMNAMLVTKACEKEYVTRDMEMIKGIPGHGFRSVLRVPIIENMPHENELEPGLAEVLKKHPDTTAVLVRNHGVFVWGSSWQKAKIQCECLDYLFEASLRSGLDAARL